MTLTPKALQVRFAGIATVEQALDSGSECLAALAERFDMKKVATLIKIQLVELNELLNLRRPLSETAIELIADEIMQTYKALTIADVYLIFRRARNGEYGELYESLNMPKVMTWFREYFDERCEIASSRSVEEAGKYKSYGGQRISEATDLKTFIRKHKQIQ